MDERTSILTGTQKLQAITWAAKGSGLSYGQFIIRLTEEEEETIYERYAVVLQERKAAEQRMLSR